MSLENGTERLHALDAVRGGVLLFGVFFHAALAFLPGPQIWLVMDPSRSAELSVLFYVLHIFRMTVFFVLAGFFARLLLERRGAAGFVRNRALRIGVPLLTFWPVALTAIVAVAIWAAVQANGGAMPEGEPPPPLTAQTFPLTHLWFLYVLMFFYAGALALRGLGRLVDRQGRLRATLLDPAVRVIAGPLAPVLLAIPVAAALLLTPDWYAWFGIPTPDTGLLPKATPMAIYGLAFAIGWLLNRQPALLQGWAHRWSIYLAGAAAATVICLAMLGVTPVLTPAQPDARTFVYAALYAFAVWAWTAALIGFAVRHLAGESPARRYLADSSYWIYLVHLPIVLVLQAAFLGFDWPWPVKYALIVGIAFAVMLASYHWLVRYSFIGAILNGKRERPIIAQRAREALAAAE